jgi:RNA polymerase sigma-70 factor, ECF subfamily
MHRGRLLSPVPALEAPPEFRILFDQQVDFVWRVLRRYGVPERDLEDACQEVFLIVHRKLPEFEQRSSLRTWIYAIASRVALVSRRKAYFRREQLEAEAREVAEDATQEDAASQNRTLSQIERALAELDAEKREAFVLYELEGMNVAEVALATGVPENTALYRLHRAREELAQKLKRQAFVSGVRPRAGRLGRAV